VQHSLAEPATCFALATFAALVGGAAARSPLPMWGTGAHEAVAPAHEAAGVGGHVNEAPHIGVHELVQGAECLPRALAAVAVLVALAAGQRAVLEPALDP